MENKNIFGLIIIVLLIGLFFCLFLYKPETFANTTNFRDNLKKAFNNTNVNNDLTVFINSQSKPLPDRLPNFKENIKNSGYNELIINDLYFDLRINDTESYRKKILIGYKLLSPLINNETNDNEKKILIDIIKDEAKK